MEPGFRGRPHDRVENLTDRFCGEGMCKIVDGAEEGYLLKRGRRCIRTNQSEGELGADLRTGAEIKPH